MGKSGDKVFAKGIRAYFYDDWCNTGWPKNWHT